MSTCWETLQAENSRGWALFESKGKLFLLTPAVLNMLENHENACVHAHAHICSFKHYWAVPDQLEVSNRGVCRSTLATLILWLIRKSGEMDLFLRPHSARSPTFWPFMPLNVDIHMVGVHSVIHRTALRRRLWVLAFLEKDSPLNGFVVWSTSSFLANISPWQHLYDLLSFCACEEANICLCKQSTPRGCSHAKISLCELYTAYPNIRSDTKYPQRCRKCPLDKWFLAIRDKLHRRQIFAEYVFKKSVFYHVLMYD